MALLGGSISLRSRQRWSEKRRSVGYGELPELASGALVRSFNSKALCETGTEGREVCGGGSRGEGATTESSAAY